MDQDYNKLIVELMGRIIALENKVESMQQQINNLENRPRTAEPTYSKKYLPLTKALKECDEDSVEFTFDQIADILQMAPNPKTGRRLPDSAYDHPAFWANSKSHSIALSWIAAGYIVNHIDLENQKVEFVKGTPRTNGKREPVDLSGWDKVD